MVSILTGIVAVVHVVTEPPVASIRILTLIKRK